MKILIVRTDALGDTILTLPMAAMLKKKIPQCEIAFMVAPGSVPLFESHPYVDKVFLSHKTQPLLFKLRQMIKDLKDFAPSHFFYVGGEALPMFVAWMRRIPFRGGLLSRLPSFFFLNKGVRQRRNVLELHESRCNLELLSPLIPWEENVSPDIHLSSKEIHRYGLDFEQILKNHDLSTHREKIFIHPGMSGHTRGWPCKNYAHLIMDLEKMNPGRFLFVLSHTPRDAFYVKEVKEHLCDFKGDIFYFDGSVKGLRHYMGVLQKADLFIGSSTGPTHLANVLRVKTIALYPRYM